MIYATRKAARQWACLSLHEHQLALTKARNAALAKKEGIKEELNQRVKQPS